MQPTERRTHARHDRAVVIAWMCAAGLALGVLSWDLPPDGFCSGDPGLKLIAAFAAIDHPERPFEVDLPRVGGRPRPWMDPMFEIHGDHAHPLQSPVFPVISAPLIAAFGLRGAYFLPGLGFVLMAPLLNAVRRRSLPQLAAGLLGFFVVGASPVFFYAFEFWEHAPAVAILAGVTALLVERDGRAPGAGRLTGAGVLGAIAMLLRPEAAWYLAGLVLGLRWRPLVWSPVVAGAAIVLLPFAIANTMHSGHPLGPHATANLAPLGHAYLQGRIQRAALWLLPSSSFGLVGSALVLVPYLFSNRERLVWVQLVGALLIAASAAMNQLPQDSLWAAWPVGVLALVPLRHDRCTTLLRTTSLVTVFGIVLTSTHDGGEQWGPRFLLIASPALIFLAAIGAQELTAPGVPHRRVAIVLVLVICACGVARTRTAYRELRGTKRYFAGLVEAARGIIPADGYALTDVWWFDQIAASLTRDRTMLYAAGEDNAREAIGALRASGARRTVLVSTGVRSDLESAWEKACSDESGSERIRERDLTFTILRCRTAKHLR